MSWKDLAKLCELAGYKGRGNYLLSLKTYLVLLNVVLLCLLFPTVSIYYWTKVAELRDNQLETTLSSLRSSMEARGVSVSQSMSLSIHEAVAGFDFSFINTLLERVVRKDPELEECLIMNSEGIVFAHNDQGLIGSVLDSPIDRETKSLFNTQFSALYDPSIGAEVNIMHSQSTIFQVASPVYNGNSLWGVLRCSYLTTALEEEISSTKSLWKSELVLMKNTFFSMVVFLFFLAVFFTLFFTARLVNSMQTLIRGVNQISNGDLKHKIEKKQLLIKEFQSFAVAFNQMSVNLHISHTKLGRYNQSLENTVKLRTIELEEINKDLEAFSYSVSHDLRAPLRAISGFSEILMEDFTDDLDHDAIVYLSRIQHLTKKMDDLIGGMLTISRVGRSEVKITTLDLNGIINGIIDDVRIVNPDKPNDISVQANMSLVGDYRLVNIVFENLINNAWKYASKNEKISIEIGTLSEDSNVFFVKDNGEGFDMEYVDKIFLPFQRLHKVEEFEGAGIGLATVARIIRRHNGRIWADSKLNEGTTLFFSFSPNNVKK